MTCNVEHRLSAIERELRRLIDLVEGGMVSAKEPEMPTITLDEFFTSYFRPQGGEKHRRNQRDNYRNHIKKAFGSWPLDQIRGPSVESFVEQKLEDGMGRGTAEKVLKLIKRVMKLATKAGFHTRFEEVRLVELPRQRAAKVVGKALNRAMLDAIESSTEISGQIKYAPLWAAYSGQRRGAQKLGEWSDFQDLYGETPMFHYRNQKNGLEQWRPLQPDAVRIMHMYIEECWGGVMPTSGLVWPSLTGKPWGTSYAWQWFSKLDDDGKVIKPSLLSRLGITEERYRWHDLRDTFVSLLLDAGVPIDDVAFLARHGDSSITAKVYRARDPHGVAARLRLLTGAASDDNEPSTVPAVVASSLPVRRSPS